METNHPDQKMHGKYALQNAVNGQREKALEMIKSDNWRKRLHVYTQLNMKNEAIQILQNRIELNKKTKSSNFLFLKNSAIYDNLRSDPRFQKILEEHKKIYEKNLEKYGDIEELLN